MDNFPFSFLPDGDVSWARGLVLEEVCREPLQEPLSWVRGTVVHLKRRWQEQAQRANSSSYPSISASNHRLLMGFSGHVTSEPEPGLSGRGRGRGSHSTCTLVHLYTHRPLRAWCVHICKQHRMATAHAKFSTHISLPNAYFTIIGDNMCTFKAQDRSAAQ